MCSSSERLDRWDAYLGTWARVRAHTRPTRSRCIPERASGPGAALTPYVLREDARGLTVHFLWLTRFRKTIIERKVQRHRQGQKRGNVWHATQDELSGDELRERLTGVARQAREASGR